MRRPPTLKPTVRYGRLSDDVGAPITAADIPCDWPASNGAQLHWQHSRFRAVDWPRADILSDASVCNRLRITGQRHGSEYAAAQAVMGLRDQRETRDADDCEVLTEGEVTFATTCVKRQVQQRP